MKALIICLFKFGLIQGALNALNSFWPNASLKFPRVIHAGRKSQKKLERLDFSDVLFVKGFAKDKADFIQKCISGEYASRNIQVRIYLHSGSSIVREVVALSSKDSLRCTFNRVDGGKIWKVWAESKGLDSSELSNEDIFSLAVNESKKSNDEPLQ